MKTLFNLRRGIVLASSILSMLCICRLRQVIENIAIFLYVMVLHELEAFYVAVWGFV